MRTLVVLNIIGLILFFTVVESKRIKQQKSNASLLHKQTVYTRNTHKQPFATPFSMRGFTHPLPAGFSIQFVITKFFTP